MIFEYSTEILPFMANCTKQYALFILILTEIIEVVFKGYERFTNCIIILAFAYNCYLFPG